jgi:hypothetical protein
MFPDGLLGAGVIVTGEALCEDKPLLSFCPLAGGVHTAPIKTRAAIITPNNGCEARAVAR